MMLLGTHSNQRQANVGLTNISKNVWIAGIFVHALLEYPIVSINHIKLAPAVNDVILGLNGTLAVALRYYIYVDQFSTTC